MCRYSFAFILETYLNLCIRLFGTDFDCRARIAICHRIFQDIIEYPRQIFRISVNRHFLIHIQLCGILMGLQLRIKFIRHLNQHIVEIYGFFFKDNALKIIASDFKKFIDELFQTLRFI